MSPSKQGMRKADLNAELSRTAIAQDRKGASLLEMPQSVYNPNLQLPYTSEELLYLVEPAQKNEASIDQSIYDGEQTPTNGHFSIQGNHDTQSIIEGRAQMNHTKATADFQGQPRKTMMEDILPQQYESQSTSQVPSVEGMQYDGFESKYAEREVAMPLTKYAHQNSAMKAVSVSNTN